MRRAAVIIAVSTGCSFHVDPGGTRFRCDLTADCPAGLSCQDGFCQGPGGDTNADGGLPAGPDATVCTPGLDECPDDYVPLQGSCYRFESAAARWEQAERACEDDCAHLVVIGEQQIDVDEHYDVHDLSVGVEDVWVGVTDRAEENQFRWVTGSPLDLAGNDCFWEMGEPDDEGGQDCVVQRAVNVCRDWATVPCGEPRPYVCEYDGAAADPAAF